MIPLDLKYSELPESDQIAFEEDFGNIAKMIANCQDSHNLEILLCLCEARLEELGQEPRP